LPLGITSRPVLDHKSSIPLTTVVQCDFGAMAESSLRLGDHPFYHCPRCERRKYLPFTRGCFPRLDSPPIHRKVVKSKEYFGDGGKAFRMIIVPRELYIAIHGAGLRGCSFTPVCS